MDIKAKVELFVLWVISIFQFAVESLPALTGVVVFIYSALRLYVFIRDELPRKRNG